MAETLTANYSWTKPEIGASIDNWGGFLNQDLDGIDSVVHGIQTTKYDASNPAGYIVDAPNDATLYGRKSLGWAHLAHTDITDWTSTLAPYALTTSVPAASSSSPLMDGTAAVGTGTTFARADHVHPTDTSRQPVTGITNGANAAAGQVGEFLETTAFSNPVSSNVAYTAATLALTAGDWEVGGTVQFAFTSGTGVASIAALIAATGGTLQGAPASGLPASPWPGRLSGKVRWASGGSIRQPRSPSRSAVKSTGRRPAGLRSRARCGRGGDDDLGAPLASEASAKVK